jgi:hypothetical protein
MTHEDISGVAALQEACFPPPFPEEEHWNKNHLTKHLEIFPQGQFVCEIDKKIVASASNCIISEETWNNHLTWADTLGGHFFENFDQNGTTMYGADISVHPNFRKLGIAKKLYKARFQTVEELKLVRYGTACRIPDFSNHKEKNTSLDVHLYCQEVVKGNLTDRTLTPLLKMGLSYSLTITDYMDDIESGNAAALLEWRP